MIATRSRSEVRTTPTLSRVLFATDGSPGAELAERLLATVDWPRGTVLQVVCVIPRPLGFDRSALQTGSIPQPDESTTRASAVSLTESAATRIEESLPACFVESNVAVGGAAAGIGRLAEDADADLIVLGSQGRDALDGRTIGSVAAAVADDSRCPVLVARTSTLNRTLIADDGSPGSAAAVEYLAAHPWLIGTSACLASVVPDDRACEEPFELDIDPLAWLRIGAMRSELWAGAASRLTADADRLHAGGAQAQTEFMTHEGLPGATLVAIAEQWRADLLVAGSRARPGGQRSPFGSVGRYVLHNTSCSVLLVPRSAAG